jgi:hypothetical protein
LGDGGFALGLQSAELGHVLFDRAADALLVSCQQLEVFGLSDPGAALSESRIDFGMGGSGTGVRLKAEGEDGVFEGAGAVEAPLVFRYSLGEISFEGADGL